MKKLLSLISLAVILTACKEPAQENNHIAIIKCYGENGNVLLQDKISQKMDRPRIINDGVFYYTRLSDNRDIYLYEMSCISYQVKSQNEDKEELE